MRNLTLRLKSVPGLVPTVRWVRKFSSDIEKSMFSAFQAYAHRNYSVRLRYFDTLPGRYALAQHEAESYLILTQDRVISSRLYARGTFDLQKLEVALGLLVQHYDGTFGEERPVLIEAGANIGSICVAALKRGMATRAIAFEPSPENFKLLRMNAILNGVDHRLVCRHAAVGAEPGWVRLALSDTNSGDHRVCETTEREASSIEMTTIDLETSDIDPLKALLWMDIQGFEGFALKGAERLLKAGIPTVVEFSRDDMQAAGTWEDFLAAVCGSSLQFFHDLETDPEVQHELSSDALQKLADRLGTNGKNKFTDILLVKG